MGVVWLIFLLLTVDWVHCTVPKSPKVHSIELARSGAKVGAALSWATWAAAPASTQAVESSGSGTRVPKANEVVYPLEMLDGVLCVNYTLSQDSTRPLRAIVDTGSPFLILPTICTRAWGCPSSDELNNLNFDCGLKDTTEIYGGQEFDTRWALLEKGLTPLHKSITNKGDYPRFITAGTDSAIVATVGSDITLPPGGVFFGLIKYRDPRYVNPTFLGQTNIRSIEMDLRSKTNQWLTLSTRARISRTSPSAINMFDMRVLGDSVFHYAARVKNVLINGRSITDEMPMATAVYAVFDSGTSGCAIHDDLYFGENMPLPVRRVDVVLENLLGEDVVLSAKASREDLFIVTPSKIPWFSKKLNKHPESLPDYDDGGKFEPKVIVLGISFFKNKRLTIDVDEKLIELTA